MQHTREWCHYATPSVAADPDEKGKFGVMGIFRMAGKKWRQNPFRISFVTK